MTRARLRATSGHAPGGACFLGFEHEEFDFAVSAQLPVAAIRDLATLRFLDRGESVILARAMHPALGGMARQGGDPTW